jgi:hypothetical protein
LGEKPAPPRHHGLEFQCGKGLAGAPEAALTVACDTRMNPDALEAFALATIGDNGPTVFSGEQPNGASAARERVDAALKALRACAPNTGVRLLPAQLGRAF